MHYIEQIQRLCRLEQAQGIHSHERCDKNEPRPESYCTAPAGIAHQKAFLERCRIASLSPIRYSSCDVEM